MQLSGNKLEKLQLEKPTIESSMGDFMDNGTFYWLWSTIALAMRLNCYFCDMKTGIVSSGTMVGNFSKWNWVLWILNMDLIGYSSMEKFNYFTGLRGLVLTMSTWKYFSIIVKKFYWFYSAATQTKPARGRPGTFWMDWYMLLLECYNFRIVNVCDGKFMNRRRNISNSHP